MSRFLVAGDIHGVKDIGAIEQFFYYSQDAHYTKEDYLILCGDVGVCGFNQLENSMTQQFLSSLPVTVLFVDGNHENHPMLNDYPIDDWNGGKIHRITEDIIHLMRGQVFHIDGRTFFTFGGAFSVDRNSRIEGVSWFEEELPTKEEYEEGWKNLNKNDFTVDYVISHTAPREVVAALGFGGYDEAEEQIDEFQRYADEMDFKHWMFGHFHVDEDVEDTYHCLMDRVIELNE